MRFIWATRGHHWGFRFLNSGGYRDPLRIYDVAFADLDGLSSAVVWGGRHLIVRFPDPLGRHDRSGRIISHDFLVFDADDHSVETVEDGIRYLWPIVEEFYARVWDVEDPPAMKL